MPLLLGGAAAVNNDGNILLAQVTTPNITSGSSDNGTLWQVWNNVYTSSINVTASATGTANIISTTWLEWNNQIQQRVVTASHNLVGQPINQTTTNTLTTEIWTAWNDTLIDMRHATAEQVAEAQRRGEASRQRQIQVEAERSAAKDRAERLLREALNPKQREELQQRGFFTLDTIAKSGERRTYRIRRGRSRNVEQIDVSSGKVLKTLCAHPTAFVPDADTMLAQKLYLESAEEDFLRIANHS